VLFKWAKSFIELILPPVLKCQLCGRRRALKNTELCYVCKKELDYWAENYYECDICGHFIVQKGLCPQCMKEKPPFNKARAVGPYRGILKDCLYNLKFRGDRRLAVPLGRILGKKLKSSVNTGKVDMIIPVPMHPNRIKERGFNQAALLAREVGREILKPVDERILKKKRDTIPQVQLSQRERRSNPRGSFCVENKDILKGRVVLLIDDIFTTGSTVAECSRDLIEAGAKEIVVGTVATGIYFSSTKKSTR